MCPYQSKTKTNSLTDLLVLKENTKYDQLIPLISYLKYFLTDLFKVYQTVSHIETLTISGLFLYLENKDNYKIWSPIKTIMNLLQCYCEDNTKT